MEWKQFQELVQVFLPRSYSELIPFVFDEDMISYKIGEKDYSFSCQEYNEILSNYSLYANESTFIYKQNELEVLLAPVVSRIGPRHSIDEIAISDSSMSYRIQAPSPEMFLAFLSAISKENIREYRRVVSSFLVQRFSDSDLSLFDILSMLTRATLSIKIVSNESIPLERLLKYANSFLFHLSYNTGSSFKLTYSISDLSFDRGHIARRRRLRPDEIETPKLLYNNELTEQYNLALSTDDPFIQFLSYYHIMEYFFDDVYYGALVSSVKEILQHPGFSSKKPKEISKIIDVVQKKTRMTKEEFQGTELEALELTIKAFITMDELRLALYEYDPQLINYYKTHEVSFSKGDTFDLDNLSNEKLPKKIAARIYKTRNSLVHNKSNNARVKERGIYHPFTNEKELTSETPLMRIIAESIIIRSAEQA